MEITGLGNPRSDIVLIQPVDEHDLEGIEKEYKTIADSCGTDFRLLAARTADWNNGLSPWKAPAVFGREGFGGGAEETLGELLALCEDRSKTYYIGGYSLAGLFALWAAYQTDVFSGVAAVSPSVWFPRFKEYVIDRQIQTKAVYLSLGNKEEKTRNATMAQVGNAIRDIYRHLRDGGTDCVLEWNEGNHFREPDLRTAKGFQWLLSKNVKRHGEKLSDLENIKKANSHKDDLKSTRNSRLRVQT